MNKSILPSSTPAADLCPASPHKEREKRISSRACVSVLGVAALLSLSGCNREPAQSTESSTPRAKNESGSPVAIPAVEPKPSAGDQAWRDLVSMTQNPPAPASWKTNEPSERELKAFRGAFAGRVADSMKDFHTRFPEHVMADAARQRELEYLDMAVKD